MKAIIAYLCRSRDADIANLIRSLCLLNRNFLPWSPADIVIFHEDGFDKGKLLADDIVSRMQVSFATVDFSAVPRCMESLSAGQRGYRHMCHFFANDIFNRRELNGYDYYMRLDDDSYILSPIKYNVFERLASKDIKYAYRLEMQEAKSVSVGMLELVQTFFTCNRNLNVNKPRIRRVKLYYTNFEICRLEWFRGEQWRSYFAAVDEAGGIWHHRWGDAPIRWLGLKYMMLPNEIWCMRDFTYFHQFMVRKGLAFRLPHDYLKYAFTVIRADFVRLIKRLARQLVSNYGR